MSPASDKFSKQRKPYLVWNFPSAYNSSRALIHTGNLDDQGDTQNSLCSLFNKVKVREPGRPKKRKSSKNPFEIGICKFWQKSKRGASLVKLKKAIQQDILVGDQRDPKLEATKIMETTVNMEFSLHLEKDEIGNIIRSSRRRVDLDELIR